MKVVATYSLLPEHAGRDIRKELIPNVAPWKWQFHPIIHSIYRHTQRWQGKVNRKDSLTYAMIEWIREKGRGLHKDNFWTALADWLNVIIIEGYRGIEWVHEHDLLWKIPGTNTVCGFHEYNNDIRTTTNKIYAICRDNWTFVDANGRFLDSLQKALLSSAIKRIPHFTVRKSILQVYKRTIRTAITKPNYGY